MVTNARALFSASHVRSHLKQRRHKDSENPQLVKVGKGKPVVSFSIGLSCDFGYKGKSCATHGSQRRCSGTVHG